MTVKEFLEAILTVNVAEAEPEQVFALLGRIGELQERARHRLWATGPQALAQKAPEDRLIDMHEVARLLSIPVEHAREMGRRGELPTVQIGKYVRVRLPTLEGWTKVRERMAVDHNISTVLRSLREGRRGPKNPPRPRPDASGPLKARGRALGDGEPLGDGSSHDLRADGQTSSAAREGRARAEE